jgi:cobyrinic acid a,c-diamide synthase
MMKGLLIAGTQSGIGKTTITLAILKALKESGYSVQSFKVGPDFIDPSHLRR